jgi:hypothetical protein
MNAVGWLALMAFSFAGGYWLGLSVKLMAKNQKKFELDHLQDVLALHTELTSSRCQCSTQNQNRKEK